jgi:hypothetical protein
VRIYIESLRVAPLRLAVCCHGWEEGSEQPRSAFAQSPREGEFKESAGILMQLDPRRRGFLYSFETNLTRQRNGQASSRVYQYGSTLQFWNFAKHTRHVWLYS